MKDNIERELQRVMDEHPDLNDFGFGVFAPRTKAPKTREEELRKGREALARSVGRVAATVQWIRDNLDEARTVNRRHTSYELKHLAEKDIGCMTKGVFIAAALIIGLRMKAEGPNACFAIMERSVTKVAKRQEHSPAGG